MKKRPLEIPWMPRKLMPLDLLDLQGNEGLVAAAAAPVPEQLLTQVQQAMQRHLGPNFPWKNSVILKS